MKIIEHFKKQIPAEWTSRNLEYKYQGFTLSDILEFHFTFQEVVIPMSQTSTNI